MAIESFSDRYAFLSNFYPCPVEYEGAMYPSAEHAYQAAKSAKPIVRALVRNLRTAAQAKKLGRNINLRPGWDRMKLQVMEDILRDKFSRPEMRRLLMATGDEELVEGNWWHDTYWGKHNGYGENHLGQLLMKLRQEWK